MNKEEYLKKNPIVEYTVADDEFVLVGNEIQLDNNKFLLPIKTSKYGDIIDYFEFTYGQLQTEVFGEIELKYKNLR